MSVERGVLSLKRIILLAEIIVTFVPLRLRVTFLSLLKHTNLFNNFGHVMKSNFLSCFQSKVAKSAVHNLKVRERKEANIFGMFNSFTGKYHCPRCNITVLCVTKRMVVKVDCGSITKNM